eukprot:gene12781-16038_t
MLSKTRMPPTSSNFPHCTSARPLSTLTARRWEAATTQWGGHLDREPSFELRALRARDLSASCSLSPRHGSRGSLPLRSGAVPLPTKRIEVVARGIRAVENFDASFELEPESEEKLIGLLSTPVAKETLVPDGMTLEFEGSIFQPTPWTPSTPKGMPKEFERFLAPDSGYRVINVPPNFMFACDISSPTRLCAVFHIVDAFLP